jgi:hypothetical protein
MKTWPPAAAPEPIRGGLLGLQSTKSATGAMSRPTYYESTPAASG